MADTHNDTSPGPNKSHSSGVASSIILDMADTTWRMFVPTVGLLLVGRVVDKHFGTKPWYMIAGITLGSILAAVLVRRQLAMGDKK